MWLKKRVADAWQELDNAGSGVVWAESQQGGAIASQVQQVKNVLASSQLPVAWTEFGRTSGLLIGTLSAVNGLEYLTVPISRGILAVKQKVFCRPKAYLRALQQHPKQLKDTLSELKPEIARLGQVILAARDKVANADDMALRTRNSALQPEKKAASSVAEAQSVFALMVHTTEQKSRLKKPVS
ncbi:hypothetical protein TRVL_09143 [Trypanosoma vivax]|nr:hypothetical protein TRVL_09143 [Trypanosoma vivax]